MTLGAPASAQLSDEAAEEVVQSTLGVYLTTPNRREQHERVVVQGGRLEIWFLRPVRRQDGDRPLCEGFRWLLTGRLAETPGVRALFEQLPSVDEVTLIYYDLETSVQPDASGRYRQLRNAAPHARFGITRASAGRLNPQVLEAQLAGPECAALGRRLVDTFWVP